MYICTYICVQAFHNNGRSVCYYSKYFDAHTGARTHRDLHRCQEQIHPPRPGHPEQGQSQRCPGRLSGTHSNSFPLRQEMAQLHLSHAAAARQQCRLVSQNGSMDRRRMLHSMLRRLYHLKPGEGGGGVKRGNRERMRIGGSRCVSRSKNILRPVSRRQVHTGNGSYCSGRLA